MCNKNKNHMHKSRRYIVITVVLYLLLQLFPKSQLIYIKHNDSRDCASCSLTAEMSPHTRPATNRTSISVASRWRPPSTGNTTVCFLSYTIQYNTHDKHRKYYVLFLTGYNIIHYYPYRAFGGQNKIVYSTRFVTRRAIFFIIIHTELLMAKIKSCIPAL